jgi:hypothetical protein
MREHAENAKLLFRPLRLRDGVCRNPKAAGVERLYHLLLGQLKLGDAVSPNFNP